MKKIILLFLMFNLFVNEINAQFDVKKINGTSFTNGEVVNFSSYANAAAELKFIVYNNATQNLDFRIRCLNILNATGINFQLCWGFECIPDITSGGIYPNYQNIINAGANTVGLSDNFKNFSIGNGTYPVDYNFRFFTRDLGGNNVGSNFDVTYRYQGPLSIKQKEKLDLMGVKVLNTLADNFVSLEINKKVYFKLINLQGQIINKGALENDFKLDMSSVRSGIYILNFTNSDGLHDSIKIYKK